jgi:hypothetical protein
MSLLIFMCEAQPVLAKEKELLQSNNFLLQYCCNKKFLLYLCGVSRLLS